MRLKIGKLPFNILRRHVLDRIKCLIDSSVLLHSEIGVDAAVVKANGGILAFHSDPITGAISHIGKYAIYISTNDVFCVGVEPKWLSVVILLPEDASIKLLDEIVDDMISACRKIGAMIVSGHTEVAYGLKRPIIMVTSIGYKAAKEYYSPYKIRQGDHVIITKGVGIEGTAILAYDFEDILVKRGIGRDILLKAKSFIDDLTISREAKAIFPLRGIHALHDVTEGGLVGALYELSCISNVGFKIFLDKAPIRRETHVICKALGVNPFKLISSGTLIIVCSKDASEKVLRELRKIGIEASIIGVAEGRELLLCRKGLKETVKDFVYDELWRIYEEMYG